MSESASGAGEDKGPQVLAVSWVVTIIGVVFAAARLYVRAFMQGMLRSDDYFTIISVVTGIISCSLTTAAIVHGFGGHFTNLTLYEQQQATIWTLAAFCPGVMSFAFPKLAVVALLTRLLLPSRLHFWFLWTLGILSQVILFVTVGLLVGRCYPASYLWDKTIEGHCFSTDIQIGYCLFAGVFSSFVDLYLAAYPSVVLFKLKLPIRQKIALSCALGVGSISAVVAIYKTTRIPSLGDPDFTYATADLQMWTVIEGSSIVIASSVPVLQPLIELLFGRNILGSSTHGRGRFVGNFSTHGKLATSVEQRVRANKQNTADYLEMTVHDRPESQEDILGTEHKSQQTITYPPPGTDVPHSPNGIMRTQEVIVKHEKC